MTYVGHYEIEPPMYKKVIEENKFILTNGMLEKGIIYLY
jgi:hypothetical protein